MDVHAMGCRQILVTGSLCLAIAASCTALNPASTDAGAGGAVGSGGAPGSGGTGTGGAGSGGKGTGGAATGGTAMGGSGMGGMATGGAGGTAGTAGAGGSPSQAGCALILHMDEASWNGTSGEVLDSCGHNNGTAVRVVSAADALPSTTTGHYGRAGQFVDSNGCVEVPDDASLHATTQLTVAAWIFPTGFNPNSNGILGKRADFLSDSSYTLFVWNNLDVNYHLYADIGNDRFNGSQSFTTNTWYHVALVYDGSLAAAQRVRLYVNGVLDGEFNESATSVPVFQTPVHVGCMPAGTPPVSAQEFIGKVDDVAVWTRALGAQEIMRLAQSLTPL
jgi:hypothetical protein